MSISRTLRIYIQAALVIQSSAVHAIDRMECTPSLEAVLRHEICQGQRACRVAVKFRYYAAICGYSIQPRGSRFLLRALLSTYRRSYWGRDGNHYISRSGQNRQLWRRQTSISALAALGNGTAKLSQTPSEGGFWRKQMSSYLSRFILFPLIFTGIH
jgi:hypothetical protein